MANKEYRFFQAINPVKKGLSRDRGVSRTVSKIHKEVRFFGVFLVNYI